MTGLSIEVEYGANKIEQGIENMGNLNQKNEQMHSRDHRLGHT